MSLTINDTFIDEEFRATQTGTADDNDVTTAAYNASAFKTAVQALSLTFYSSPTGFPQFAENVDFVSSSHDPVVTNYFLSGPGGAAISGVETDLMVGGDHIFLYATANSDIVVGRLGTGTTANPSGAVVLVIGLDETKSGGFVIEANMWLSLYAPIVQGGHNLVDSADQLDLSGLIYLGSSFDTTTTVPFENFDGVPSGNNLFNVIFPSDGSSEVQLLVTGSAGSALSTVNVSSTGIGSGSQAIDVGNTLRIDTVQGMVKTNVDDAPEVNNAANISYHDTADSGTDARVELVAADFGISQVNPGNPNERVDIEISAYNVAGADQGQTYLDNINNNGTSVQIDAADVRVMQGTTDVTALCTIIQDGNSVIIRGLDDGTSSSKTDGYQVYFTTDGVHFDRLLIKNVDSSTTLDVNNIHVTSVTGGSDTEYAELGSTLHYQDDGPNIDLVAGAAVPSITDDETAFATNNHASFAGLFTAPDYGADKPGTLSYILGVQSANVDSGLIDTLTGQHILLSYNAATNTVFGKTASSGVEVFRITVSASGEVTLDQKRAIVHSDTTSFDETSPSMAAGLITLTAKVVDSEGATTGDSDTATALIGGAFHFKDDGPAMNDSADATHPNDLEVGNVTSGALSSDSSSYGLVPGADGQKSFTIVNPDSGDYTPDSTGTYRWSYANAGHTAINGYFVDSSNVSHPLYTLVLDPATGGYLFTMVGKLPPTTEHLTSTIIHAGGPANAVDVAAAAPSTDYGHIVGASDHGAGAINASHGYVGVDNGNLDGGESITLSLHKANGDTIDISGIKIGTKSAGQSHYITRCT